MTTLDELDRLEYFSEGRQPTMAILDGESIDREVAEKPCAKCGTTRSYRAVYNPGSYRAFSVCYPCRDVAEF